MTRRLVTYVAVAYLLAVMLPAVGHAAGATTAAKHGTTAKHHSGTKASATPRININTAPESELTSLPGIDEATAQKIVSMRPYKSSSQLVSKNIVTKEEFSKIRTRVSARQEAKKADAATKEAPKTPDSSEGTTK
jgi:DNA uptake protein ComE-like DNA-binding protein